MSQIDDIKYRIEYLTDALSSELESLYELELDLASQEDAMNVNLMIEDSYLQMCE